MATVHGTLAGPKLNGRVKLQAPEGRLGAIPIKVYQIK